jgi:hypothetical protein
MSSKASTGFRLQDLIKSKDAASVVKQERFVFSMLNASKLNEYLYKQTPHE